MAWWLKTYKSVAQQRMDSMRVLTSRRQKGETHFPIEPFKNKSVASTFWGQAWCRHIECLSDFESRLDKGKRYVRNGSVCHLLISKGRIDALVSGSELYELSVQIDPIPQAAWKAIKLQCSGQIGSVVELLQGRFSDSVMKILTDPEKGMFPHADDFRLDCNCPDFARLCKHLAAVLYGVGVKLDTQPELLFTLRGVDHFELIDEAAAADITLEGDDKDALQDENLGDVFGIDLDLSALEKTGVKKPPIKKAVRKKSPIKKSASKKSNVKQSRIRKTPSKAVVGRKSVKKSR